jgi:steroid 5-alpha reductase family enzyme
MIILLLEALGAMAIIMAGAWAIQRATANAGWIDVVWTFGTGLVGVGLALAGSDRVPWRGYVIAAMVALWSVRLGLHIALRVAHGPEDARYTALRETWGAGFQGRLFWFLEIQAVAAALLGIAIVTAADNPDPTLRPIDLIGIATLFVAIFGEGLADEQLRRFKSDPTNRGKICNAGLWGWSRHPNYFFEWLGWVAYPLLAIHWDGSYFAGFLSLIGPLLMYAILVYGSGIPYVERQMAQSRGAAFQDYAARTSAFFPLPPRKSL